MAEATDLLREVRLARRHLESVERQLAETSGLAPNEERAAATARTIQTDRRRRSEFLPTELFGEPCWDMLLALYLARSEGDEAYSYSVFRDADVAPTTGTRYLDKLEAAGLAEWSGSMVDRRKKPFRLTDTAYHRMTEMLCALKDS